MAHTPVKPYYKGDVMERATDMSMGLGDIVNIYDNILDDVYDIPIITAVNIA